MEVQGITIFRQFSARLSNSQPSAVPSVIIPSVRLFSDLSRDIDEMNIAKNIFNGADTTGGLAKEEVTKTLISAVISGFTNSNGCGIPVCPDCENLNATQDDYASPTTTNTNGLFLGMDCTSWFMWEDNSPSPSFTTFWNNVGTANYNQYTCKDLPESSTTDSELLCLGVPINNGLIVPDPLGDFAVTSTADICNNIEITLIIQTCDGTGSCIVTEDTLKLIKT